MINDVNHEAILTITVADLENMVRRMVRAELIRLLHLQKPSLLEDERHEGSDNAAEDELLLDEALAVLEKYENDPDAWSDWAAFKAELTRAEAAGELST